MVRAVAAKRGETLTQTVAVAVKELERRTVPQLHRKPTVAEAMAMLRSLKLEPINEHLTEDEILGYGPDGYCE